MEHANDRLISFPSETSKTTKILWQTLASYPPPDDAYVILANASGKVTPIASFDAIQWDSIK